MCNPFGITQQYELFIIHRKSKHWENEGIITREAREKKNKKKYKKNARIHVMLCFSLLDNLLSHIVQCYFPFECILWLNFWSMFGFGSDASSLTQLHDYDKNRNSFQLQIDSESFGCSEHHNRSRSFPFHFHGAWVSNWIHHTFFLDFLH